MYYCLRRNNTFPCHFYLNRSIVSTNMYLSAKLSYFKLVPNITLATAGNNFGNWAEIVAQVTSRAPNNSKDAKDMFEKIQPLENVLIQSQLSSLLTEAKESYAIENLSGIFFGSDYILWIEAENLKHHVEFVLFYETLSNVRVPWQTVTECGMTSGLAWKRKVHLTPDKSHFCLSLAGRPFYAKISQIKSGKKTPICPNTLCFFRHLEPTFHFEKTL